MSSNDGLYRALIKLLPLSKALSSIVLGRLGRPFSKNGKIRGTEDPSISASDSFCRTAGRGCGGEKR